VIVQSESEKNLRRLVRKEEKRINKLKNKMEGSDDEDSDIDVRLILWKPTLLKKTLTQKLILQFDPVELRAKRQQALTEASLKPIFTSASMDHVSPRIQEIPYPFVFDSMAKAKLTAGNHFR
jgi:hypothetical protein